MSPSELDTKAPSVPPHPFKVGDKVRGRGGYKKGIVVEVLMLSAADPDEMLIGDWNDSWWCHWKNVEFAPGGNEVKAPLNDSPPVASGIAAWLKNSKGEKFEVPKPEDTVNHPNHYTAGTLETIDAIEAMVGQAGWSPATGYRLGNVLKYLWRHAHKGGLESLKKAKWYLDREIAAVEKAAKP